MSKRRNYHPPEDRGDIHGSWVGIIALTASHDRPILEAERNRLSFRLRLGLENIRAGANPEIGSWRDLTDCMNFLQSAVEMGMARDEGLAIDAAKAALLEAEANCRKHGKIRMSGLALENMRNLLDQYEDIIAAVSARDYWRIVKHTQRRTTDIVRRGPKQGDTVVHM